MEETTAGSLTSKASAYLLWWAHEVSVEMNMPPSIVLGHVKSFVPKAWFLRKNRATLDNIKIPYVNYATTEQICPVRHTMRYLELDRAQKSPVQTSQRILHAPTNRKNLAS